MRKKKLIEQNLSLFDNLQKTQLELIELKKELGKNADEIEFLKAQLSEANKPKPQPSVVVPHTEPMRRLEEKIISNASLSPDMEYGAAMIGKIVVLAAEHSNKLSVGADESRKELINLILGKTEIAKAEILTVVETNEAYDVKCAKMEQIFTVTSEYFNSVMAQIV